jgi:hypothetical protein
MRLRVSALVIGLVGALVASSAGPAAGQETPAAALDRGVARPGESVEVTGTSWPDGSVVQAQLCGNEALNGSVDCDRANALTVGVGSDGLFSIQLPVTEPPTPCPCVVLVTSPDLIGTVLRLPLEISGVPVAPPKHDQSTLPVFSLTNLRVAKHQPLSALFGAGHDRTVVMTVENLGATPIESLPITVTDADAPEEVIADGELKNLEPGDSTEVRLDFPVRALAHGTTTLNVTVDQSGKALAATTSFSTFPWLLAAVAFLVLLTGLLAWGAHRRRQRRRDDVVEAIAQPQSEPAAPAPYLAETYDNTHASPAVNGDRPATRPAPMTVSRAGERALSDDLARLIAITLRDIGSVPPTSDTDALAERMAIVIVSQLQPDHDLDPSASVALTASITDELARELRQVVTTPT